MPDSIACFFLDEPEAEADARAAAGGAREGARAARGAGPALVRRQRARAVAGLVARDDQALTVLGDDERFRSVLGVATSATFSISARFASFARIIAVGPDGSGTDTTQPICRFGLMLGLDGLVLDAMALAPRVPTDGDVITVANPVLTRTSIRRSRGDHRVPGRSFLVSRARHGALRCSAGPSKRRT